MARRKWRPGDRREWLRRRPSTVPERPVVTVLLDDTDTAYRYFLALRNELRGRVHLDLHPAPRHGATPLQLAETVGFLLKSQDPDEMQPVWCLIDLEGSPDHEKGIESAFAPLFDQGVKLARSQPCFELWTLLHFTDKGSAFMNCAAVRAELNQEWSDGFRQAGGKKAQLPYDKIIDRRTIAAERARRQRKHGAPSWTELYLLIEEIERLASGSMAPPT